MSPFSFFKKKDKEISKTINNLFERPNNPQNYDNITIDIALEKIEEEEESIIKENLRKLKKICEETKQSFEIINDIAEKIEEEKTNQDTEKGGEVEKLVPLINNTRNIITKSLKRESAMGLQVPETFDDLVKFKDSVDSSIKRFGEVTRSHSVVINNFMKKHANSLRSELKKITENYEKINENYEKIINDKDMINECKNNLLNIIDKRAEIGNDNKTINSINQNIKEKEEEIILREKEIKQLQDLPSYINSLNHLKDIERLEQRKDEIIHNISDTANQLSKAAHKYSYGGSKETKRIINTLINEPIKIIENEEISPYIEFLNNLKVSINKNEIMLKDTSKVIPHCDKLIESLPNYKEESNEIILKIKNLEKKDDDSPLEKVRKIEMIIDENKKNIQSENLRKKEIINQKIQDEERLKKIKEKAEEQLFYFLKKRYVLT